MATMFVSQKDIFILISLVIYAPLAFVPFYVFIYPRLKMPRKPVSIVVSLIEILVMAIFFWAAAKMMQMPPNMNIG